MNNYLQSSLNYFLTDILMFICSCSSFIICFLSRKKSTEFRILYLYPLSSFIIQLSLFFIYLTSEQNTYSSIEIRAEKIFLIIEFICIYDFFKSGASNKLYKKHMLLIAIAYFFIYFLLILLDNTLNIYDNKLYFLQNVSIATISILSLIQIFKNDPIVNITEIPSFWVITGCLLYFLCTMPLYFFKDFIYNHNGIFVDRTVYSLNYLFYSILFLLLIKAVTCKKPENQY